MQKHFTHLDNKVHALVQHCIYMIATGKWLSMERLPSIRTFEEEWGINRLTIQKALKQLEHMGLVKVHQKSGYYVQSAQSVIDLTHYRYEMENLHSQVTQLIKEESGRSPLSVLRYLTRLEEIRCKEKPDFAFCECTQIQANGHAEEIFNQLGIPVLPLTVDQIKGQRKRIPRHVRALLTTHFHYGQLLPLKDSSLTVVAVLVEVSPKLKTLIQNFKGKVFYIETEEVSAKSIATDSSNYFDTSKLKIIISQDIESELLSLHEKHQDLMVLLSPRNWGSISSDWRTVPSVIPIEFRIHPDAWPGIADTLGLVLGSVPQKT